MKLDLRLAALPLALLVPMALVLTGEARAPAQTDRPFKAVRNEGTLVLEGFNVLFTQVVNESTRLRFDGVAAKPASITASVEGFRLTATRQIDTTLVPRKENPKKQKVQVATATGATFFAKEDLKGRVEATGQKTTYTDKGETGDVVMAGAVTLKNATADGKQASVATGDSLRLTVSTAEKEKDPVRTAILEGKVSLKVNQKRPPGKPDGTETYTATGDRLEYRLKGTGAEAVLTGTIKLTGTAEADQGETTGITRVVIQINEKQEAVSIAASGEPVSTTLKLVPKKKKGGTAKL